jgi:hypothetical protein
LRTGAQAESRVQPTDGNLGGLHVLAPAQVLVSSLSVCLCPGSPGTVQGAVCSRADGCAARHGAGKWKPQFGTVAQIETAAKSRCWGCMSLGCLLQRASCKPEISWEIEGGTAPLSCCPRTALVHWRTRTMAQRAAMWFVLLSAWQAAAQSEVEVELDCSGSSAVAPLMELVRVLQLLHMALQICPVASGA